MKQILATAALLGAAVFVCGCATAPAAEHPELLKQAEDEYFLGNFTQAAYHYEQYLASNPNYPKKAEVYLQIGRCQNGSSRYDLALSSFERALSSNPDPALRLTIVFQRAITYNLKDDPGRAMADLLVVDRAAKDLRDRAVTTSHFLKQIGITSMRTGDWAGGRRYLQRLADEFPQSGEADEVKPYLEMKTFAVQVAASNDESGASTEVNRLKGLGFSARAMRAAKGFIVVVGDFPRFEDAVRERGRLRDARVVGAFIVP